MCSLPNKRVTSQTNLFPPKQTSSFPNERVPSQVKLWYDKAGHQLIVNVLQATELPTRPDGRPRNPYVKMYFLPDRR